MKRYIIAHDIGTSGDKASLVDVNGNIVRSFTHSYCVEHPRAGWAQQDPEAWWNAFCLCNRRILDGIAPDEVAGVCLAGQMMCCLPVDRQGTPLFPAMIWADSRAEAEAEELRDSFGEERFFHTVGMRISANYGLPKMMWLKRHKPATYQKTYKFLSPKDFINQRLTGRFVTDAENASFLHCYDWQERKWSEALMLAAGVDPDKLPDVLELSDVIGPLRSKVSVQCGIAAGIPVIMGPGDGCAATLGAAVLEPGEAYTALGTSSWVCVVSGSKRLDARQRTAKINYLGTLRDSGTMQAGGYAYSWMERVLCVPEQLRAERDSLSLHRLTDEYAALSAPGAGGVLFQPYLMGERAPIWDMRIRGAFLGLTAGTTRADLCRSVMEGVALHLHWIYRCIMSSNHMKGVSCMKMVGGGATSPVWTQIFADIFALPIDITGKPEQAGALGTAVVAGVGLGIYPDYAVIREFQPVVHTVEPDLTHRHLYAELDEIFEAAAEAVADINHRLERLNR